ncbi:alpha/beta hydrolase family protein [Breznakiella homolactica]|uniref:Prolyl oligopeptidase family serine peptidase n=1 Tax=Breznakiella homolactica TaxID=2798577 RepID=A0A7T7XJY0_9SPIR|nr:prolyl oligopeptidase family serine peptidase [Breznakiella homolactica]QQO07751.1 prolyl oligopeptidase family serine peptidase [Breznakiella homolactica]
MDSIKLLGFIGALSVLLGSCASIAQPTAPDTTVLYNYIEEAILVTNGDHQVPAIVTLPVCIKSKSVPAVVMLHGYGSDSNGIQNTYRHLTMDLAKQGIASVRLDFSVPDGTVETPVGAAYDSAVSDVSAIADYLVSLEYIDGDRIGILGWGHGGTVAMVSAGENTVFKSIVIWTGDAVTGKFRSNDDAFLQAKDQGFIMTELAQGDSLNMGLGAVIISRSADVTTESDNSEAPVLEVQGDGQGQGQLEILLGATYHPMSKLILLEGTDTAYNFFIGDPGSYAGLSAETVDWFKSTL